MTHPFTPNDFRPDVRERFWAKVDASGDCWEWTASRVGTGYGSFALPYRATGPGPRVLAHRYAYVDLCGDIPEGLVLDHLCRNTTCVNPDHLQPVTDLENLRRGTHPWMVRHLKDVCRRGHKLTPDNTRGPKPTSRQCLTCKREYGRRWSSENWARRKQVAA